MVDFLLEALSQQGEANEKKYVQLHLGLIRRLADAFLFLLQTNIFP